MINLLQGIVDRLGDIYPNTNIYVNDVDQGLVEPCFFIRILNTQMDKLLNERYEFKNLVAIDYLNQNGDAYLMQRVKQRLLLGMRNINIVPGKASGIYGRDLEVETDDDKLVLTARYDYIGKYPIKPDPLMATNRIIHYTDEEPYKEATKKVNPGMWETPPREPRVNKVYPALNPRDPRYRDKNKGKMWQLRGHKDRYLVEKERYEQESEDLMRVKEMEINDKSKC